ncbi:MAG: hypothetical protein JWQ11_2708 [Rhizobacter sp.]|nr:hypothetical protein [Rhizobacter sp.]
MESKESMAIASLQPSGGWSTSKPLLRDSRVPKAGTTGDTMAAIPRHLWLALFIERHDMLQPRQLLGDLLRLARGQWTKAGHLDPVKTAEAVCNPRQWLPAIE